MIKSAPATPSPTINPVPTPATGISSNQPIELCGNFICESDEDSASCPSDCADRAFLANEIGAKGNCIRTYTFVLHIIIRLLSHLFFLSHYLTAPMSNFFMKVPMVSCLVSEQWVET